MSCACLNVRVFVCVCVSLILTLDAQVLLVLDDEVLLAVLQFPQFILSLLCCQAELLKCLVDLLVTL